LNSTHLHQPVLSRIPAHPQHQQLPIVHPRTPHHSACLPGLFACWLGACPAPRTLDHTASRRIYTQLNLVARAAPTCTSQSCAASRPTHSTSSCPLSSS
jgi:hypothetical protein